MNPAVFHDLAYQELAAAAVRCERERLGAGARLMNQVDGVVLRIAATPRQGSPYLFGTRRYVLTRFPYSTVYLALDAYGYIVAVAHHRRRPGYWRRRLKDA